VLDQTTPFRFTVAVIDGAIEGPSTAATTECPRMRAMGPVLYILVFVGRREHRGKKKKQMELSIPKQITPTSRRFLTYWVLLTVKCR
jgi:hypothetical protein